MMATLVTQVSGAADDARADTGKLPVSASTAPRPSTSKSSTGRGPLPDPALLDGSTLQPEKRPEHGMIGDFELPGDENVRNGKVGGQQNPNPQAAGGGASNNMPAGLPKAGGGGAQGQQGQQQAGGAQAAQAAGAQQAGGAQSGGPQNANAAGNPIAGAGDPGAQAQGIQVAELGGDGAGQQAAAGGLEKPPQVAIGDSAMKIETSAAAQAGVVGGQQVAGQTQQHEKGTGSGGKGAGGAGGPNRVEKGRAIPAGL